MRVDMKYRNADLVKEIIDEVMDSDDGTIESAAIKDHAYQVGRSLGLEDSTIGRTLRDLIGFGALVKNQKTEAYILTPLGRAWATNDFSTIPFLDEQEAGSSFHSWRIGPEEPLPSIDTHPTQVMPD